MDETRQALERLSFERKASYAALSRLLGRNVSYLQQFMTKGSPRHLDERDRQVLARFFGVEESVLGGPSRHGGPVVELVHVPVLSVEASAGPGSLAELEAKTSQFGFEEKWLKRLTASKASSLSIIQVVGDSMEPTLSDGDEVMVDLADGQNRLRDGIYVLRMDDTLKVKRIETEPKARRISVVSDNPLHRSWSGLERRAINIVGRVLWFGRKLQ
jgi:phage repressor protein C with HTH and peptisase S24 domain